MENIKKTLLGLILLLLSFITACTKTEKIYPQERDIVDAVFGSGHIENKFQYTLTANANGYLKKAFVIEGDTITKGKTLFTLVNDVQQTQVASADVNYKFAATNAAADAPQIAQLKLQITQAIDKAQNDSLNYKRFERLVKNQAVSQSDYDNARLQYQSSSSTLAGLIKNLADLRHTLKLNLENARSQLAIQKGNNDFYTVTGQSAGIILTVTKKVGDFVAIGSGLATVGAGPTIIKLLIAEDDIRRIKVGQTALISLNSNKDQVYNAVITKVYPAFDAAQQSFIADAVFDTLPPNLINGTQLQSNIIINVVKKAMVVPSWCLRDNDSVLLADKSMVKIKAGIKTLEWTQVLGGIKPTDQIIPIVRK